MPAPGEHLSLAERASITEAYLSAIVQFSDDAIIGKTLDGIILSWNPGAERLYQYTAQEVIGEHISVITPPEHPDELRDIMRRLRAGERIEHFETERVRKDGTRLHVSVTISPVRDATGKIIGASAIARDVSERRRLEEEHIRLLEEERRIHAATAQARQEAEEASRAKDEFLAMVSHEFRSPLNAVTGWLHVLRSKRADPAHVERALDAIQRNTRLLTKIVDDLLDVSRFIAGRISLELAPVEVSPLIETVLNEMEPIASEKRVSVESYVDARAGPVLADPGRLQQIVGNVLTNAIKFTPAGGRVEVHVQNDAQDVVIVFSDTGQGISPEFLPHVFEAFRQADPVASRVHGGLGLGLAIVHHLVTLHRGTVTVESAGIGQGCCVTVRLPRMEGPLLGRSIL
jgi:PAS domain S-box-containing protein